MPVLPVPEGITGDPFEVDDWEALVLQQGPDITAQKMEEGDVYALQDRASLTDEWTDGSRRIVALRWDADFVAIYTTDGTLIDESDNFTPGGLQVYARDFGDNSFCEEWGDYYRVPPGKPDDEDTAVDTAALAAKLVPGCRVGDPGAPGGERCTVILRKGSPKELETIMVVFDDSEKTPPYREQALDEEFVSGLCTRYFLEPDNDIAIQEQAAGLFLTRNHKHAEGIFVGRESVGSSGLVAPLQYVAMEPADGRDNLRYAISFGHTSLVMFDMSEYVLLRFLISTAEEHNRVRYYAVIGDEGALHPSPRLMPRYYVVPMVMGREAMLHVTSPLSPAVCRPEVCERFEAGLHEFLQRLTPNAVANGDFSPPPKVSLSDLPHTFLTYPLRCVCGRLQPMSLRRGGEEGGREGRGRGEGGLTAVSLAAAS